MAAREGAGVSPSLSDIAAVRILQYWVLTVNQSNILYSYALSNHQHNCREGKTLILQELIFNGNEFFPQVHDESRQIVCLIEYFDHFLETFNLVTGLHCTVLLSLWKDYFKVLISVVTKIKKKTFHSHLQSVPGRISSPGDLCEC